jgi:DNA/RNA-binding domain of Phe-tRNA-synthetase-like protein
MEFTVSKTWQKTYPGASVGVLAMRKAANPDRHDALDLQKEEVEKKLRSQYAGYDRAAFKAIPTIQAYNAYYKRFKKSYHVQLQLESVVLKGKSIPHVATLVEAMFAAELEDLLLTAGHDLDKLQLPVGVDVADGSERYVRMNGQEQVLKAGDMFIADAQGVISSIIYGPDRRTEIVAATRNVLFTTYAPPGIDPHAVRLHLQNIASNVLLIAPYAEVDLMEVYTAEG